MAISLAFGATVLVFVGTLTTTWWSYESDDKPASMGLIEARICSAESCRSGPVGGLGNDRQWVRAGSASYAGGFVAGGLLLAVLLTGILRRERELLIKTAMVANASALISAIVFVWLMPDFPGMSAGYSMYTYFAGTALGVGAGVAALRVTTSSNSRPEEGPRERRE